jgi:hypothetical protein
VVYAKTAPGVRAAMYGLEAYVDQAGLEPPLLELVKVRASLINGCNRLAIAFRTVPAAFEGARRWGASGGPVAANRRRRLSR